MCELLVGLPAVTVLGIIDEAGGPLWVHAGQVTNGPTEAVNNLIKRVKRVFDARSGTHRSPGPHTKLESNSSVHRGGGDHARGRRTPACHRLTDGRQAMAAEIRSAIFRRRCSRAEQVLPGRPTTAYFTAS